MIRLEQIRARLEQLQRGFSGGPDDLLDYYTDDVVLLVAVADAALAYEAATQIPDGVQRAEQDLFSALAPLKELI